MPTESPKQPWDARLRDAASHVTTQAEDDLRRRATYVNHDLAPDVRRNGSAALRKAAQEFQRLAQRMDESNRAASPGSKPPAKHPDKP